MCNDENGGEGLQGGSMRKLGYFILLVSGIGLLAGCAGGGAKPPAWTYKSTYYKDGYIYAVGVANASPNIAMSRTKVEAEARAKLAEVIKTYVSAMTKRFMEEAPEFFGEETGGYSSEYTMRVIRTVAEATLKGSEIVEYWPPDPKPGKPYYALARVPKEEGLDKNWKEGMLKTLILKAKTDEALREMDKFLKEKSQSEMDAILRGGTMTE